MMVALALGLLWLAGWSVTGMTGGAANRVERAGLALLFGYGLLSLLMFLLHLAGFPIAPHVYVPALAIFALDGARRLTRRRESAGPSLRSIFAFPHPVVSLAGGGILLFLLAVITARCLYLPNTIYDSITGFDLLGKVIAKEEVFRVSLFDYSGIARRGIYPPFVALTLAWGYQASIPSSMMMMIAPLLAFLLWLFGFARRYLGGTSALGLLILALLSPDFYTWCQLPATQVPVMAFGALFFGYILAAGWDRAPRALLSAALAGLFLAWSRPDAIVFIAAGGLGLLTYRRDPNFGLRALAIVVPALLLFGLWQFYAARVLGEAGASRMILVPFWDAERVRITIRQGLRFLFHPLAMGFTGYAFLLAIASQLISRRPGLGLEARLPLATLGLYWILFYQTDPVGQDPLAGLMATSYRRGITALVVPMWFACLVSPVGVRARRTLGALFAPRARSD